MSFTYPVYIPSVGDFVNFRELLNKQYVVILKYLANNDNTNIDTYINRLIDELNDDTTHDQLNKIDKLCVMITIRIMCIGPDVDLTMTCDKTQQQYNGKIELTNVLQMLADLNTVENKTFQLKNNITVHAGVPTNLWYDDDNTTLDVIMDTITGITVNNTHHNMNDLTIKQKNDVLDRLPDFNLSHAINLANESQQSFNDLIIFQDRNPHDEQASVQEYKLGLYDNSMFDMIKMCYSSNIQNYYMSMYTLCDTMGFTADYIQNITPVESNIYINQKRQEIERQKQSQSKPDPTIGGGLPSEF